MREDGMTLQAIGDEFGVTRERIRQLVGSPLRPKTCDHCGQDFLSGKANQKFCSDDCRDTASRYARCACGERMSIRSVKCWDCKMVERSALTLERRSRIAELWGTGLPVEQMAERLGYANANVLSVELATMRNLGWELPFRRGGWVGHSLPTRPAPRAPATPNDARNQLAQAIRNGQIRRSRRCEACGREGHVDAHHHDYSKPLFVEWLCKRCHMARHSAERKAVAA